MPDGTPASWYKLLAHTYVKTDFVICIDADIIPLPGAPPIHLDLIFDQLNLCIDMMIYKKGKRYNEKFWYNCGLIGIPLAYSEVLIKLFNKHHMEKRVCWEQLYVNELISDNKIMVNTLREDWNYMIRFDERAQHPSYFIPFKHITAGKDFNKRISWAKQHYYYYVDELVDHQHSE